MRAILSVSDKRGVVEFAQGLIDLGYEIVSTGNTMNALAQAGVQVMAISDVTGFPEMLEGRVKTLHPAVHGGILARRSRRDDITVIGQHGIKPIDLVCVNLYPFAETIARPDVTFEDAVENIDIGGPSMIRSAAKNHQDVTVVCDPDDYDKVLNALRVGGLTASVRRSLAAKAFQHTASYDTLIAGYLRGDSDPFPSDLTLALEKVQDLRYGENPHQQAAFYRNVTPGDTGLKIATAKQLHGQELSFNNILDADAALGAVAEFGPPAASVIKHTNPCGLAVGATLLEAYRKAFEGDTVSAYGGIVALNREIDGETAAEVAKVFYEIIIAPSFSEEAKAILTKKKNLRLLETGNWLLGPVKPARTNDGWDTQVAEADAKSAHGPRREPKEFDIRRVSGGLLVQTRDNPPGTPNLRVVTKRTPTQQELEDLLFAWRAVKHVKSNAIVLAKGLAVTGMGAGQPNRVTSVGIAIEKAGEKAAGSVLASDAFFPFADNIEIAAKGGITAIIQPGGSIRDEEAIKAADDAGMAMVFTGVRHFRH